MALTPEQIEERRQGYLADADRLGYELGELKKEYEEKAIQRHQLLGAAQALLDLDKPMDPIIKEVLTGGVTIDENGLPCVVAGLPTDEASSEEEPTHEE